MSIKHYFIDNPIFISILYAKRVVLKNNKNMNLIHTYIYIYYVDISYT